MLTAHHGSHAGLFTRVAASGVAPGALDAIIVPTARPGWYLGPALEVASELDCPLLCLSSGHSDPGDILKQADTVDAEVIVVKTTDALTRLLPRLDTTRIVRQAGFARRTDLSGKRNLGLLISRAMNWNKILFLDDDIHKLAATDLRALAGLLDHHEAVGLGNSGYPDNSVVCHAYREVGGPQETFVSGGLLSVRSDLLDGYFPDIYNEDWFFLHTATGIASTGTAYQDPYDPFGTPNRARDEELGDCLAEGLYWLRDEGLAPDTAHSECFWQHYLAGRRGLIDSVVRRLGADGEDDSDDERKERNKRLASLAAARAVHTYITPELCTKFIRAWETDREAWLDHRDQVPTGTTIEDCLHHLERQHSPTTRTDWATRIHRPAQHFAHLTTQPLHWAA